MYKTSRMTPAESVAPAPQEKTDAQVQQSATQQLYALGRCSYSSNGKVVTVEPFTELVAPDAQDLADLKAHGLVLSFSGDEVSAAKVLQAMPANKRAALKKVLGL
jgi:hypothetical protein